jgi:hypothetical protein
MAGTPSIVVLEYHNIILPLSNEQRLWKGCPRIQERGRTFVGGERMRDSSKELIGLFVSYSARETLQPMLGSRNWSKSFMY